MVSKYNERKKELKDKRMERLRQKQQEKHKSEIRKQTMKVKTTDELMNQGTGVWKTITEMNEQLKKFTDEKSKKNALLTQIKFHKNVLKSKGDSKLFAFSSVQNKKRVQHKVEILIENLAKIIEMNHVEAVNEESTNTIRSLESRKEFFLLEKEKLKNKLLAQREKLKISKEMEKVEKYLNDIDSLVNSKIKHKCVTDDGQEWFEGQIISVKHKNEDEPIKSEFWVKYLEDDEETQLFFLLLKDLKAGDLMIFDQFLFILIFFIIIFK